MEIIKLKYHHGHKKGLVKTIDDSHSKGRGKYKGIFRWRKPKWYMKDIQGTPEELERAWKVAEEYLYKLINYAEHEDTIPPEEIEEARRIFAFVKQGPRAHHFVLQKDSKLTSADVLYILSTTLPGPQMAKRFNILPKEVVAIRNGSNPTWEWEYNFVKRLRNILRSKLRKISEVNKVIYRLSRVKSPTETEIILYATGLRKAKQYRENIITQSEMKKLMKENTLDIIYPIEAIELV